MTTPKLNRIVTVSGSSTQSAEQHIRWGSNDRASDAFNIQSVAGGWYADKFINRGFALPDSAVLASDLVAFLPYMVAIQNPTVSPDGTHQINVPVLRDTLINNLDRLHWLRVRTPDSEGAYVEFYVLRITVFVDAPFVTIVEVGNDEQFGLPILVGEDFTLAQDSYTQFEFENHTHQVSTTTITDRRVWGDVLERGSQLGVLDISTDDPTQTASEETATAVVRYQAALAVGETLTDDLGRVWTVEASHTTLDRRFLEYDLTRMVA